jgi:hypothetical protein
MYTQETATDVTDIVSVADYQFFSKDSTTASGTIETALTNSLRMVENYLQRWLVSDERTESLQIQGDKVYPSALPVTVCTDDYTNLDGYLEIESFTFSTSAIDVTYTGGYSSTTIPFDIKIAIIKTANSLLNDSFGGDEYAGATQVKLGDMAISYANGRQTNSYGVLSDEVKAMIDPYRLVSL